MTAALPWYCCCNYCSCSFAPTAFDVKGHRAVRALQSSKAREHSHRLRGNDSLEITHKSNEKGPGLEDSTCEQTRKCMREQKRGSQATIKERSGREALYAGEDEVGQKIKTNKKPTSKVGNNDADTSTTQRPPPPARPHQ